MSRAAVPRTVHDGMLAVRESGLTNMLDSPAVAGIAEAMDLDEAGTWVRADRGRYGLAVFLGALPDDEVEPVEPEPALPDPVDAALAPGQPQGTGDQDPRPCAGGTG